MKIAGREIPIAMIGSVVTLITTIIGAWLFMDDRFAHAGPTNQAIKLAEMSSEESTILIRMDIMEERMAREKRQTVPDTIKIEKMDRQLQRMEKRYDSIQQIRDKTHLNPDGG